MLDYVRVINFPLLIIIIKYCEENKCRNVDSIRKSRTLTYVACVSLDVCVCTCVNLACATVLLCCVRHVVVRQGVHRWRHRAILHKVTHARVGTSLIITHNRYFTFWTVKDDDHDTAVGPYKIQQCRCAVSEGSILQQNWT